MKTKLPQSRIPNGNSHPEPAPSPDLAALIKADSERREKACMEAIQRLLAEHNCGLRVVPNIVIDGRPAGLLVFANPPEPAQ